MSLNAAADVALDCQVVDHQENVSFVEMLGVAAGPASSSIISVRLKPGTAYNTTQVGCLDPELPVC